MWLYFVLSRPLYHKPGQMPKPGQRDQFVMQGTKLTEFILQYHKQHVMKNKLCCFNFSQFIAIKQRNTDEMSIW